MRIMRNVFDAARASTTALDIPAAFADLDE
jgi:hypothetical protein